MTTTTSATGTAGAGHEPARLVSTYRSALTWLGLGTALGAVAELAMLRHWQGPGQIVPWALLAVLLAAAVAWLVRRRTWTARAARTAGAVAVLGSGYGLYEHLKGNLADGALDPRYAEVWASMSAPARWWAAGTGAVGDSPLLAPGMIGLAGALLWLATLRWRRGTD